MTAVRPRHAFCTACGALVAGGACTSESCRAIATRVLDDAPAGRESHRPRRAAGWVTAAVVGVLFIVSALRAFLGYRRLSGRFGDLEVAVDHSATRQDALGDRIDRLRDELTSVSA